MCVECNNSSSLYFTYELNCIRFVVCCWTDQNHVWNDGFPFVTSPFQCSGPGCFFFTIFLHSIPIQDNCEQFSQICNSMFLRCDLQNHCHWFRKPLPINIRERWRRESTFEPEHTHYSPLLFTRSQSLHNTLFRHFSDFVPNRSEILANWIDFTHCLECLKTSGSGWSIEWLGGNALTQQTHNCLIKLSAQCSLNGESIQHSWMNWLSTRWRRQQTFGLLVWLLNILTQWKGFTQTTLFDPENLNSPKWIATYLLADGNLLLTLYRTY